MLLLLSWGPWGVWAPWGTDRREAAATKAPKHPSGQSRAGTQAGPRAAISG